MQPFVFMHALMLKLGLFQQEISAAAEVAIWKYKEDSPSDEVRAKGVVVTMKTAIREATEHSKKKLSKIVSVANPALGQELQEVCIISYGFSLPLLFQVHVVLYLMVD